MLSSLIRSGNLPEAVRILRDQSPACPETRIDLAELLYLTGEHEGAEKIALAERGEGLAVGLRSRLAVVHSCCLYERSDYSKAEEIAHQALGLAEASGDSVLCALAAAQMLGRAATNDWRSCLPLANRTRKYAVRAGDAQVSARVHLVFGRLEGKVGHYDAAIRHFAVARQVIETDRNLWISAAIDLDHASVLGLCGNYLGAVNLATRGAADAAASGWLKGQALACTNLAFFYVMLGRDADAKQWLDSMPSRFRRTPAYRVAIAETLAQAEFSRGEFDVALRLLDDTDIDEVAHLDWYRVSRAITKTHILLASGDRLTAKRCAAEAIPTANKLKNSTSQRMLRLLAAEASIEENPSIELSSLVTEHDHESSIELQAAVSLVRGRALRARGALESGSDCLCRGARLLQASNVPAKFRALTAIPEDLRPSISNSSATLDAAVALLELAGHPHILGAEAVALLKGAGCAARLALVVTGPAGSRVVDAVGWEPAQAAAAAAAPTDGVEHLPLGTPHRRDLAAGRRAAPRAGAVTAPSPRSASCSPSPSRSTATAATRSSAPRCGRPMRSTATATASGPPSRWPRS